MKKYKVDLAVGCKRDCVYTPEVASETEAIRHAVGIMKLEYRLLKKDIGYFVYSIEEI